MSKQHIATAKKRTKKQERREEEHRQELERQQRRTRTRRILIFAAAIVVLAGITYLTFRPHTSPGSSQPAQTNTSSSSSSSTNSAFAPVNGVSCDSGEHYDYHHHIHLSMYINGQAVAVPQSVGINTNASSPCLYWLHTHDTTGIVHIESPVQRTYTLGNFFDVWSGRFAQLGYPAQLSQANGWQVYVNSRVYKENFRSIPMEDHTLVTLAYNSPNVKPETAYNWNGL